MCLTLKPQRPRGFQLSQFNLRPASAIFLQKIMMCTFNRHYDMNPRGDDRKGRTNGNVFTQLPNGFTKGSSVHSLGPDIDTTAELRWQKPYVARYMLIINS